MKWICCQIGAREHYAIPRALHHDGALELLLTDLWLPPGNALAIFNRSFQQRFHRELGDAVVVAPNVRRVAFELKTRLVGHHDWSSVMRRNEWFQNWAVRQLESISYDATQRTVFAYSYAALKIFQFARKRGWRTILGQIDPGPRHEDIVAEEVKERSPTRTTWKRAPKRYWDLWSEECELSDIIVANSEWSKTCLVDAGIVSTKVRIIPLSYTSQKMATPAPKSYPAKFTPERPLRVLFLGQVSAGKGMNRLLAAATILRDEPIEFWIVGSSNMTLPANDSRLKSFGSFPHTEVHRFYRNADVFILPTLSDGFALTQLEAMESRLPVIASTFCGTVVRDGVDGVVLNEASAEEIARVLLSLVNCPERLEEFSKSSEVRQEFSLDALSKSLAALEVSEVSPEP